jgi:uncharacterized peroxidase-related enzyme
MATTDRGYAPAMPRIPVSPEIPGIRGLFQFRPETAQPMLALAQTLLRGESSLTEVERELIATHVSTRNRCRFCASSHGAAAASLPGGSEALVESVVRDPSSAEISEKLKALLVIAGKIQSDAQSATDEDFARARSLGASDRELHDTVLIAAAFSMFNRYVDGLGAITPTDPDLYRAMGQRLASRGYQP